MKISDISINKPLSVIALTVALWVLGVFTFQRLPVNLLPDITYPMVKVYVDWKGATPQDIEDNIAEPLEQKMSTIDKLDYLESQCMEGKYQLLVNFTYDADRDIAYQDVLAKINQVRQALPKDATEPLVLKADPSQLPVMDLIVTSTSHNLAQLRAWVENYLQPEFVNVSGTAGAEVSGGLKREIRVLIDPFKVQSMGLTPDKIVQRIKEENTENSVGRMIVGRKDNLVRVDAQFTDLESIRNIVVSSDAQGKSVYLKDVARVEDSHDIQRVYTRIDGKEGVKMSVFKQDGFNTIEVESGIQQRIKELRSSLPAGMNVSVAYDQADYIRSANKGVKDAAVLAGILVLLVTILFLNGWRRVFMIALSLPVSLFGTFICMNMLGFSINIISLGGLVVAITVILDDSIVVLENITRLQHAGVANPIKLGVEQVGKPVLFSMFTFVVIFLPFLFIPGLTSLLFKELGITVAIAIIFSFFVSRTVIPALSIVLFKKRPVKTRADGTPKEGPVASLLHIIENMYSRLLSFILRHGKTAVILIVLGFFTWAMMIARHIGSEFIPQPDDGMVTVKVKLPTGTSAPENEKVLRGIEKVALSLPDVQTVSALGGGRIWGLVTYEIPHEGEVDIQLTPKLDRKISTDKFVKVFGDSLAHAAKYPGAKVKVFHTKMKGIRQVGDFDVEIEVYGPKNLDINELYATAAKIQSAVKDVKGLVNLDISMDASKPEYTLAFDKDRLAEFDLSSTQAMTTARTLLDGQVATQYKERGFFYPVRVVADSVWLTGREDLRNVPLFAKNAQVYLRDVATLTQTTGPLTIDRRDRMRIIKVTGSVVGGDVGSVTSEVYKRVQDVPLPQNVFVKAGGQARMMQENNKNMMAVIGIGILLAFVLLIVLFESITLPAIVILSIPLALTGFFFALSIAHVPMGVTAYIGIIVLIGMLINHWVLLISFIEEKRAEGMERHEAIVSAAATRLRPIIMTFLTAVLGLLPFVLNIGDGVEILRPLGVSVVGGISFSLLITFFFIPVVYSIVRRKIHKPSATEVAE
jgi:HAE1 family hydrophobic/amphiphilic exporter-1